MTAEIAIANKSGVALAADSKVTIGGGIKTYDTVNKVFTLSKVHPVGIMIFGNADFMHYPWETIVKIYRAQKGAKSHRTVAEWGADFVKFLEKFGEISASDRLENLEDILRAVFFEIREDVRKMAKDLNILPGSDNYTNLMEQYIDHSIECHINKDYFYSARYMTLLQKRYAVAINTVAQNFFGNFSSRNRRILPKAKRYAMSLLRSRRLSPLSSGIVIAGFGEDEIFPAVLQFETDGYVGTRAKMVPFKPVIINKARRSAIIPFAQKDMMCRFMDGIDPEYKDFMFNRFAQILSDSCVDILDRFGTKVHKNDKVKEAIRIASLKSIEDHLKETELYQRKEYSSPIVRMVAVLPKEELPHLAESLVALTSLKRHVSNDAETVGGPIDVALISKSDGFIWIKRKHYFKAELNPHFAVNYRRGLQEGKDHEKAPRRASRPSTAVSRRRAKSP